MTLFDKVHFFCNSGLMAGEMNIEEPRSDRKSTAGLKLPTGPLDGGPAAAKLTQTHFIRSLAMRFAEAAIFLTAVVGAIALGMGITDYFAEHRYVLAYLVAYAGFRCSDLLIRGDTDDLSARDELVRRISVQLPLLAMFAAAPFERTYIYGGPPPVWLSAFGLLLELLGMWLALGARMQLGYFSSARSAEGAGLVKRGVYRYVRHPIYAGTFLVTLAWPLVYGAPITAMATFIIGSIFCYRRMKDEDAAMLEQFGQEYQDYMHDTDALIPTIW
jgi:protein-S-isoprenylcysteine O-methyltransferase Ste14